MECRQMRTQKHTSAEVSMLKVRLLRTLISIHKDNISSTGGSLDLAAARFHSIFHVARRLAGGICLSACLSLCLPVCLYVCLFVVSSFSFPCSFFFLLFFNYLFPLLCGLLLIPLVLLSRVFAFLTFFLFPSVAFSIIISAAATTSLVAYYNSHHHIPRY